MFLKQINSNIEKFEFISDVYGNGNLLLNDFFFFISKGIPLFSIFLNILNYSP